MLVPFENLASASKIWIYQSNKALNQQELEFIEAETASFLTQWTAHGDSLQAGFEIFYNQFIIIAVNENVNEASGCSIDKSVNHIKALEKALNISLLERSKVAIMNDHQITLVDFSEIKKMISEGIIGDSTSVFNNSIVSKDELSSQWIKPAKDSWIGRYF